MYMYNMPPDDFCPPSPTDAINIWLGCSSSKWARFTSERTTADELKPLTIDE